MNNQEISMFNVLNKQLKEREREIIILKQILWACAKQNGGTISLEHSIVKEAEQPSSWLKCGVFDLISNNFDVIATTKEEIDGKKDVN
jgi:hypothetical protein